MDLPLKPNILEDVAKDHWIAAPPAREKYVGPDGGEQIMLEDESGRLRLTGSALQSELLVTGCIVAVMGTENANGDFEVIDLKLPDLPMQPERWSSMGKNKMQVDSKDRTQQGKIAIVSGLDVTGESGDTLMLDLLTEWLLGESATPALQQASSKISRLIIAGNSLAEAAPIPSREDGSNNLIINNNKKGGPKKYGYDASSYNPAPTAQLDSLLSAILPSIPITLLPGASDPANVSLPQQPLHPALFPNSRAYAAPGAAAAPAKPASETAYTYPMHPATNPSYVTVAGQLCLISSGQAISDIAKYLQFPSRNYTCSMDLMEATLRWRVIAPTAPDTLWCYPYRDRDPFVMEDRKCPHLYISGNADKFETRLVDSEDGERSVRCVCVPKFNADGDVVVVDTETLEVEVMRVGIRDVL